MSLERRFPTLSPVRQSPPGPPLPTRIRAGPARAGPGYGWCRSALLRLPIELPVDRAGRDAEELGGEVLVALGVSQRLADGAQLDLLHRRPERDRERASF